MTSIYDRFTAALAGHELVRIERRAFDARDRETLGFPLAVSAEFVLISLLSDRIDLDGFEVLRLSDITTCDVAFPRKAFYLKALDLKGETPKPAPDLDLANMDAFLRSAQQHFRLLVIHREHIAPGECDIGRLKLTTDDAFAIHYIDPSAQWADEPGHYRHADVTRVGFGGEYETTLALVAGGAV